MKFVKLTHHPSETTMYVDFNAHVSLFEADFGSAVEFFNCGSYLSLKQSAAEIMALLSEPEPGEIEVTREMADAALTAWFTTPGDKHAGATAAIRAALAARKKP